MQRNSDWTARHREKLWVYISASLQKACMYLKDYREEETKVFKPKDEIDIDKLVSK